HQPADPFPAGIRESEVGLRPAPKAGDRIHDSRPCEFAACLPVPVRHLGAARLQDLAEQGQRGIWRDLARLTSRRIVPEGPNYGIYVMPLELVRSTFPWAFAAIVFPCTREPLHLPRA